MRKMLFTFLICLFCAGSINAQDIDGNYQIDSVSLTYTWFTRPMEQLGTDGNLHIAKVDTMLAGYEVAVHFPFGTEGTDAKHWNFALPVFDPAGGEVIGQRTTVLPSEAILASQGVQMNVDFFAGGYRFNEGSTYPGSETSDCVTALAIQGVDDIGVWNDGNHAGVLDEVNYTYTSGWAITESGVFANFQAPNMNTDTYGQDYGPGTSMPNWGYLKIHYSVDDNGGFGVPIALNVGWEAIQGVDSDYGIVDSTDDYFDAGEAALGLMNDHFGVSILPTDSVTILGTAAAYLAATGDSLGFLYDTSEDRHPPYMLKGPGAVDASGNPVIDPNTNLPVGLFTSDKGYVFDPTGDLLGGGDGIPFSGDEYLAPTGYFFTWNVLKTIFATTYAIETITQDYTAQVTIQAIVDSVISENMIMWGISDAVNQALSAPLSAGITHVVDSSVTAVAAGLIGDGMSQAEAGIEALKQVLPGVPFIILNQLAANEANLGADPNGNTIYVDDSQWDLDPDDWIDFSGGYAPTGTPMAGTYEYGGRIFVGITPACVPMREFQQVDTHWYEKNWLSTNESDVVPEKFELLGNFPNPFNPTTKIRFSNDKLSNIEINIYSVTGAKVSTVLNKQFSAGTYDVTWNGRGSGNKILPSGMYLYEIKSDNRVLQGKMLFLK